MGVKIPLQSTKYTRLWRRVTAEVTGLPSLLPPLAAAKHAEDYKNLKLKYVFPFIQCQCFDKRRGVFFSWKKQRFIKIRVFFLPEISALGVFFNFDNEHMHPPKYPSAPPRDSV